MKIDIKIDGLKFISQTETKNQKNISKFLDDKDGRIVKITSDELIIKEKNGSLYLTDVKFMKNSFDVIEYYCKKLEIK
ncbi:hypothetical protein [Persephonella sp.]